MNKPAETHHPNGPSSLKRRELCPISMKSEAGKPDNESDASKHGQLLHKCCYENNFDELNEADTDLCKWSIARVVEIMNQYNIIEAYKEEKVDIFYNDELVTHGTADLLILAEDKITGERLVVVMDYKMGRKFVNVKNNIQLQTYGVGGCQRFGVDRCDYWIVQPVNDYCAKDSFDDPYVPLSRVMDILGECSIEFPLANPSEEACCFCKAKLDCPYLNKMQTDLVVRPKNDVSLMTPKEVADRLDKIATVETLLKAMKLDCQEYIKANNNIIDGRYQVYFTKGRAKALKAEEAYQIVGESDARCFMKISQTDLKKAYVEANYVKGTNTKKSLGEAFKIKIAPLLRYGDGGQEKLKKL